MKRFIVLSVLFFVYSIQAQKTYKFPEKFNPYYNFKPEEEFQKIKGTAEMLKKDPLIDFFNRTYIFNEQYGFDGNGVYMDWNEVEVYLLKILHKVLPANANRKEMDLFLLRDLSANASASRSGKMFFNIGMLCNAENEAFIAAVIAHEIGHCLLKHTDKKLDEYGSMIDNKEYFGFMRMSRRMELQADSVAIECLINAGINPEPLKLYHEDNDVVDLAQQHSRSYKNMLKASNLSAAEIKHRRKQVFDPFSSHPSAIERYAYITKSLEGCNNCGKNFFVDSLFFVKLKKLAREERKKIAFESCKLDPCISYSFIDFLYDPKNIKNLYFLMESTRRTLYVNPKLATTGFLTENVSDDELFYNSKSILHKPEFLFSSYKEFGDLKNHPFIEEETKPFETYEQAFLYFTDQALKINFNEANFSRALYYYSIFKTDSVRKYLENYINQGVGLNTEYANRLLHKEKTFNSKGKILFLYNNVSTYTKNNFNYYLSLKRKENNVEIRQKFGKDSNKVDLVIVNELLGKQPYRLYEMHKIMHTVFSLYNETDIEMCKKIRLTSHFAGETNEIPAVNRKQFLIYAPEWYNWLKEHSYDKLFLVDVVYQYKPLELEESFNNYTGYYIDMNQDRPYFRDASRSGFKLKQKESEIHNELYSFLYE